MPTMGSTVCVRCGANLVPHSYCDICHDVLCFTCSSCSMNTIERIYAYHKAPTQDSQKLLHEPISSQLVINDNYFNNHYFIQDQLNDKIKDSSIKIWTSYWNNIFEAIKLVNGYWNRILNIGNSSSFLVRW
jgi:hypothetical protein